MHFGPKAMPTQRVGLFLGGLVLAIQQYTKEKAFGSWFSYGICGSLATASYYQSASSFMSLGQVILLL